MISIAENITNLMKAEGITASELSRQTGIDRSVLHKILSGATKNPSIDSIKSIINHYSFDEVVLGIKKTSESGIPIITWSEAANLTPDIISSNNHKTINTGKPLSRNSFALIVEYSLDSRFPEGTLLIIEQEKEPKNLGYVIVKEGENKVASIKRYILDGGTPYLKSIDPSIPSIKYNPEVFKIIGIVSQSIFDFD